MQVSLDQVDVDPRDSAGDLTDDSGYDEGYLSTESVQSSIFEYEQENGRTYHAFRRGKYAIPNDEKEQERMDIHYHAIRLCFDEKHWICPLDRPRRILDVGTGTGIWAIDVADDFPDSQVVGIDLSPIQPTAVPPNLEFQVMDADETWTFSEPFDLVHTRLMNGFSIKDWEFFYSEAFKCMMPGAWVENQEFDLDFPSDDDTRPDPSAVISWRDLWEEGIQKAGLTSRCQPQLMQQQMRAAGFVNVSVRAYKLPMGPWAKNKRLRQAGLLLLVGMHDGLDGLSLRTFTQFLGWSVPEMEVLLAQVRAEWKQKRIHTYLPM